MENKYKDKIFVNIEMKFKFIDRMKILFGIPLIINSEIETENEVGNTFAITTHKFKKDINAYITKIENKSLIPKK